MSATHQAARAQELRRRAANLSDYLIRNRDVLTAFARRPIVADMKALLAEAAAIEAELSASLNDIRMDGIEIMPLRGDR